MALAACVAGSHGGFHVPAILDYVTLLSGDPTTFCITRRRTFGAGRPHRGQLRRFNASCMLSTLANILSDIVTMQEDFLALADRIAASYAGFNASAGACDAICRSGATFALKDVPANLAFFSVRIYQNIA